MRDQDASEVGLNVGVEDPVWRLVVAPTTSSGSGKDDGKRKQRSCNSKGGLLASSEPAGAKREATPDGKGERDPNCAQLGVVSRMRRNTDRSQPAS